MSLGMIRSQPDRRRVVCCAPRCRITQERDVIQFERGRYAGQPRKKVLRSWRDSCVVPLIGVFAEASQENRYFQLMANSLTMWANGRNPASAMTSALRVVAAARRISLHPCANRDSSFSDEAAERRLVHSGDPRSMSATIEHQRERRCAGCIQRATCASRCRNFSPFATSAVACSFPLRYVSRRQPSSLTSSCGRSVRSATEIGGSDFASASAWCEAAKTIVFVFDDIVRCWSPHHFSTLCSSTDSESRACSRLGPTTQMVMSSA